jgi:probable HAF family extracellular repeat protein
MVGLGFLPGGSSESYALGTSADGSAVVGYSDSTFGQQAFRWTESGGMVGLGDLPGGGFYSHAISVSADGSTVVGLGSTASGGRAFVWTESGGMVDLGTLSPYYYASQADAVSGDGSIVVGLLQATANDQAFIWDATHGMRLLQTVLVNDYGLDLTDWVLSEATAISPDGTKIAGYGLNPNGNYEAWYVDLNGQVAVPEPSSFALVGLITVGGAWWRRRRSK